MPYKRDNLAIILKYLSLGLLAITILLVTYNLHIVASYVDYTETSKYIEGSKETLTEWFEYKHREAWIDFKRIFHNPGKQIEDDLDTIYLYIDTSKITKLDSALPESGRNYKSAEMSFQGKKYDIDIRYRGDTPLHWMFNKKSYKIKIKDDKKIKNHKIIQLRNIKDAAIVNEYIVTLAAKKMGLLTVHKEFVKVYVNDEYQGLYLYLEPTDKAFLEENQKAAGQVYVGDNVHDDAVKGLPLDIFKSVGPWQLSVASDSTDSDKKNLDNLLRSLAYTKESGAGFAKLFQLLDRDYFARFTAWLTVIHTSHIDHYHNVVLYFDETLGKFIQIPWDAGGFLGYPEVLDWVSNDLFLVLHKNPNFVFDKNLILSRFITEEHLYEQLRLESNSLRGELLDAIYADDFKAKSPMRTPLSNSEFEEAYQEYLGILDKHSHIAEKLQVLDVAYAQTGSSLDLIVNGWSSAELSANDLYKACSATTIYRDRNQNGVLDAADRVVNKNEDFLLHTGRSYKPPTTFLQSAGLKYPFIIIGGSECDLDNTSVKNVITGEFSEMSQLEDLADVQLSDFSVHPWQLELEEEDNLELQIRAILNKHNTFRRSGKEIIIPAGRHDLNENLIFPLGVTLKIQPGATLRIAPDVSLLSYAPIQAQGSANNPIRVIAQDPEHPFGTFALLGEGAEGSYFQYFQIENGSEAVLNGAYLSGMFSAYHVDDVVVENSSFSYSHSDDGLNFKYSNGKVLNSRFYQNSADAIDFDFMSGEISGNVFIENGNDAIDTSGSSTLIADNYIYASGDKCMSLGENSSVVAINNIMNGCNIGVECKDSSTSVILNSVIVNNKTGINSYQKKDIFGGAHCEFYNNVILANDKEITFENTFEAKKKPTDDSDIKIAYSLTNYEGEGNIAPKGEIKDFLHKNWLTKEQYAGSLEQLGNYYDFQGDSVGIGLISKIPNAPLAYE
ncbi:MAG: CotH kinase family protein [Candidatus Gracilibacteria bacterium]|nr:CotH kinase family protein [Candidatus Gracilibacteria bacterium]